jgi:hypothetical protein
MRLARLVVLLVVVTAVLSTSCRSVRDAEPDGITQATPWSRVDLSAVTALAQRSHFAFRVSKDGALAGGHATYGAALDAKGTLLVVPRWPSDDNGGKRRAHRVAGEPTVRLSTTEIGRAGWRAAAAVGARLEEDGSAVRSHGAIIERFRNGEAGVEQSWELSERPAGSGDLVVRVRAETAARPDAEGGRVRFVDARTRRAMQYGAIAWVDANGKKTPLRAELEGAEIVLRVPASVVDDSRYPAALDPTIGPEKAVDDPIVTTAINDRFDVTVSGGKNGGFLIAWADERVMSADDNLVFGHGQFLGARVSDAGALLDPTGLLIGVTRDFDVGDLKVSFDGQNWLVAWYQYPYNGPCNQIVGVRLSEAGAVLDPLEIPVTCAASGFHVGFDGQSHLFVWTAPSLAGSGTAAFGAYVSAGGVLTTALPFAIVENVGAYTVGCDLTTTCLLVERTASGLRGHRIGKGGVLGAAPIVISSAAADTNPSVAFDGTNFIIAWQDASGTREARVAPTTWTVLDQPGVLVMPTPYAAMATTASGALFVKYGPTFDLLGVRTSNTVQVLDATPFALTAGADPGGFDIAGSGNQYLLAWEDASGNNSQGNIRAGRITTAGALLEGSGFTVRNAANPQARSAVAGDATGYLAVWEDGRPGDYETSIRAARLDPAATSLDPASIELAPLGSVPKVAYGGSSYLVVYDLAPENSVGGIRARLVSKATGLPGAPIALGTGYLPAVAFDGTNFVTAFVTGATAQLTRVTPAGAVLDTTPVAVPIKLSGYGASLGIASSGQELLLAYNATTTQVGVAGIRLSKSLQVLDAAPLILTDGRYDSYHADVAWDGREYFVVWQEYRDTFYIMADIRFGRVLPTGQLLDPGGRTLASGPAHQWFPAVSGVGDGATALVAWSDNRRPDRYKDYDIYGAFVRTTDGAVLDTNGFVVSGAANNELFPALTPGPPGSALLSYARIDMSPGLGALRVKTRFVTSGKLVAAGCTTDAECGSRACSDGVCCEEPCGGACKTCSATPGKCTTVTGADDADSCSAESTCDTAGACRTKGGKSCTTAADCVTGFCSRGICCESACDGACETCAAPPGRCTLRDARSDGEPKCAPYACDGTSRTCPGGCASDASCPNGARCDVATGTCITGAYCLDTKTLAGLGPEPTSCSPYSCESGACRTTCRDTRDCVFPAVCDEAGRCVSAPTSPLEVVTSSGCATSKRRSTNGVAALLCAALVAAVVAARRRERRV